MGRCPLPHVDPNKIQVDAAVWSEMQKSVTDALTAQRDVADKIASAVASERAAAQAQRSYDVTGVGEGNKLLRAQLAAANEDARDRDKRILELLDRVDKLQQEVATLKGARADITLADNRDQRSLELARAQIQSGDDRFRAVLHQLAPLVPLLTRVGMAAAASKMSGGMPGPAPEAPREPVSVDVPVEPTAPPEPSAPSEPEVIQAVTWTNHRIEEWKAAMCEFIQKTTPSTAAAFRFYLCETNVLGLLSAPPEALPELVRALMAEAGPELVQRIVTLTAAARPS